MWIGFKASAKNLRIVIPKYDIIGERFLRHHDVTIQDSQQYMTQTLYNHQQQINDNLDKITL